MSRVNAWLVVLLPTMGVCELDTAHTLTHVHPRPAGHVTTNQSLSSARPVPARKRLPQRPDKASRSPKKPTNQKKHLQKNILHREAVTASGDCALASPEL